MSALSNPLNSLRNKCINTPVFEIHKMPCNLSVKSYHIGIHNQVLHCKGVCNLQI